MPEFERFHPIGINPEEHSSDAEKAASLDSEKTPEPEFEAAKLHDQLEKLRETLWDVEATEFPRFQDNIFQQIKEWWVEKPRREQQRKENVHELLSSEEALTQIINSDDNFGDAIALMNRLMEKKESYEEWEAAKKGKQADFYSTQLREFGAQLAIKNLERMEEFLRQPERHKTSLAARTIENIILLGKERLVSDDNPDWYSVGINALEIHFTDIQKEIETQLDSEEGPQESLYDCASVLRVAVQHGNPEMVRVASDLLVKMFRIKHKDRQGNEKFFADSSIAELIKTVFEKDSKEDTGTETQGRPINALAKILESYGLNPKSFWEAWQLSVPAERRVETFLENLKTIRNLESERPQIVSTLSQQFGIRNFARYSEDLLVQQFDERDKSVPYGIVLYPIDDWNGAFSGNTKQKVFEQLKEQLGQYGYTIRILEAKGKIEVAKSLVRLNESYGQEHKISFGIIGAHGNKNTMVFGREGEQGELRPQDFLGKGVQRAGKFFADKPVIILDSCLVGQDKGIAESLSKAYNAKVIASDGTVSGIRDIKVKSAGDEQLDFDVDFSMEKKGKVKIFTGGSPKSS